MQYQQQLPVPVGPPNQQAAVGMQNLPHQPPFVVPIQVSPQVQQLAPFITGATLMDLLQNSGKNELRSFFLNLMSMNGWQNQQFANLVQQVAYMAEYLIFTKNMHPQQAIPQAAADICLMDLAQVVQQFQGELNRYITQPLADGLNASVQRGIQWNSELQRFQQQMAQQMNQGGYGGGQQYGQQMQYGQQGGYGNVQGGYPPANAGRQGGMGYGGGQQMGYQQGFGGQGNQGFNPQGFATRQGATSMFTAAHSAANVNPVGSQARTSGMGPRVDRNNRNNNNRTNEMLSMEPDGTREIRRWRSDDNQERVEREQTRQPIQVRASTQIDQMPDEPQRATVVQTPDQWPKFANSHRPFDSILFEDGTELRPAHLSGWTVTFSFESPYRTIYDPTQFVLFHLKRPDGSVIERLEPRTSEMDYLQHELNPKLQKQARDQKTASEPEVVPQWQLATRVRNVKESFGGIRVRESATSTGTPVEAAAEEEVEAPKPHVMEDVATVHGLKEAELKLTMFAKSSDIEPGTPVEFHFEVIAPVVTDSNLTTTLRELETATSFEELQSKLQEANDELPDDVKTVIDQRLTTSINEALQMNFGLSEWKIDSFRDDYSDLLGALREPPFSDMLVDLFCSAAPEIIGRSLSVLRDDAYAAYLTKEVGEAHTSDVLAFRDRCSITQVPWKFEDMNITLNGGGLIPQDSLPELHAAASSIFDRTQDWPVTYAHRYLQTSDKKMLELRRGYLGVDAYLLFEVQ